MAKQYSDIRPELFSKKVSECTRDELIELLELVVNDPIDGPFGMEVRSPLGLLADNQHGKQIEQVCQEAANRLAKIDNKKLFDEIDKSIKFLKTTCTQSIAHLWGESDVQKALDTLTVMRNVLDAMQITIKKEKV